MVRPWKKYTLRLSCGKRAFARARRGASQWATSASGLMGKKARLRGGIAICILASETATKFVGPRVQSMVAHRSSDEGHGRTAGDRCSFFHGGLDSVSQ